MLEAYRERFRGSFESHRAYFEELEDDAQAELQKLLDYLGKFEGMLTEPLFVRLIDNLESYHFTEFLTALSCTERLKGALSSADIERYLDVDRLAAATIALTVLEKVGESFEVAVFEMDLDRLVDVFVNPVISMIYQKRGIVHSDYVVWQEPITPAVAFNLLAKGASDDAIERRVSEVFNELNRFRQANPSQKQMMRDMCDPAYYSPEAQAQDAVQEYFIAQLNDAGVLLAATQADLQRLSLEGASTILPDAEKQQLAAQIESDDSYSTRNYVEMMACVDELLSEVKVVDVSAALAERIAREPAAPVVMPAGVAAGMRYSIYGDVPEAAGTGAGDPVCQVSGDDDGRRPLV
ncbi:MAG: hypothetical protein P1U63_10785 [Coxiellaceae bacterium]|nr:hypothetical protein [Coxiellaceae bacterium]